MNHHEKHEIRIESRGILTVAVCSCGWVSKLRANRYQAERDGDDHQIAAAGGSKEMLS